MRRQFNRLVTVATVRLLAVLVAGPFLLSQTPTMAGEELRTAEVGRDSGIAARYPGDRGIAKDPAYRDGIEELWVDGELSIRKADVRFRRVPHLWISFFSLETYYHGLPKEYDAAHPIKVYYDNFVMAKQYIGPMRNQEK
jgi:hypothetical protein